MIVQLPDHFLSNSAARRTKFWIKRLTGVDTTKSDGYAFLGTFCRFEETVDVPEGTLFMSYIEDTRASGRVDGRDVQILRAADGGLETVCSWKLDDTRGWALKIRDEVAALFPAPTVAPLTMPDPAHVRSVRDALVSSLDVPAGKVSTSSQAVLLAVNSAIGLLNQMLGEG
jgi:hypothetical protein